MSKLLAKVHEVFEITGRGVVIVLHHEWAIPDDEKVVLKECIIVRRTDQSELRTHIRGIEMLTPDRTLATPPPARVALVLPADVTRTDVDGAFEVWLERDHGEPLIFDGGSRNS